MEHEQIKYSDEDACIFILLSVFFARRLNTMCSNDHVLNTNTSINHILCTMYVEINN